MDVDLAKLSAGATQGEWVVNPFCAQIDCAVESKIGGLLPVLQLLWPTDERSEAETSANAAFIVALVNAYRTGQLVERDGVVEACANIVGKAMTEADINGRDEVSDELYQVQCAICNLYTATLTATAGASHD